MEGLSRLILKAKEEGVIGEVHISMLIRITHLLFVDDFLLFGKGPVPEWKVYKDIFDLFSSATRMSISGSKSLFLVNEVEEDIIAVIKAPFIFEF